MSSSGHRPKNHWFLTLQGSMPKMHLSEIKEVMQYRYTVWRVRLDVVTRDFNVGPAVIRSVLYEKDIYVYLNT